MANAKKSEKCFVRVAGRPTGVELRSLARALNKYREPIAARRFTVIRQQNNGAHQVPPVDSGSHRAGLTTARPKRFPRLNWKVGG